MFDLQEVEVRAINYLAKSQQCDLATHLMNKYPKGSLERIILKSIRFGVDYGKPNGTVSIHADCTPEEMMARFEKKKER